MTPVGFDKFHGEVFNGPRVDSDPSALGPRLPALPPTLESSDPSALGPRLPALPPTFGP